MSEFEKLLDEVLTSGLEEGAVIDNYFLTHYPYLQGIKDMEDSGEEARKNLLSEFSTKDSSFEDE